MDGGGGGARCCDCDCVCVCGGDWVVVVVSLSRWEARRRCRRSVSVMRVVCLVSFVGCWAGLVVVAAALASQVM